MFYTFLYVFLNDYSFETSKNRKYKLIGAELLKEAEKWY